MQITRISLENYKCFDKLDIEPGKRTKLTGRNRVGKTTVMDSVSDILTGKMSDGTTPDNVRPHDKDGQDKNRADVVRQITFDNGTTIRKVTKQKWRRPRGTTEEVFDGNATSYEIDGFPYEPKAFNAWITENIGNPDNIALCMSAAPFTTTLRKSTADARKVLEQISGFDSLTFAQTSPEYKEAHVLLKGHAVEDVLKKLRKDLATEKKKMEAKHTEIKYEQTKAPDNSHKQENEVKKAELIKRRTATEKQISELINQKTEFESLSAEKAMIEVQIEAQQAAKGREIFERRTVLNRLADMEYKMTELIRSKPNTENAIAEQEKKLAKTKELKPDCNALEVIKAETFTLGVCPVCGSEYTPDKAEELHSKWLLDHQSKIAYAENEIKISQDQIRRSVTIEENILQNLKDKLAETESKILEITESIKSYKENIGADVNKSAESLLYELGKETAVPFEPDRELTQKHHDIEIKLSQIGNISDTYKTLENNRKDIEAQISILDAQIASANAMQIAHERELENLKTELKMITGAAAETERQIDCIMAYSMAKNQALSAEINKHFHHFQFQFLDTTQEGNVYETCRMMVDGTDYLNGLNGGDKRLTECDLCRGFQSMTGLNLPIFIDEANTVDVWRIPTDMEQQLFLINRTDSERLEVEIVG